MALISIQVYVSIYVNSDSILNYFLVLESISDYKSNFRNSHNEKQTE